MDIGLGDELIEPTDRIQGEGWFDFAGLPRPAFRMISREQQFAEKLHAYTRPRLDRDNSRVKDLVDLLLLMQTEMDRDRVRDSIEKTFAHRATDSRPTDLPSPPESWRARFQELGRECDLDLDMESAVKTVASYARCSY